MFTPELDLRAIQIFLAVAEGKSVKKASEKLKISSPAISQALRLLEEDLGTELFLPGCSSFTINSERSKASDGRQQPSRGSSFAAKQDLLKRICVSIAETRYRRKCDINDRSVPSGFIKG